MLTWHDPLAEAMIRLHRAVDRSPEVEMSDLIIDYDTALSYNGKEFIRVWQPAVANAAEMYLSERSRHSYERRRNMNTDTLRKIDTVRSVRNGLLYGLMRNNLSPVSPSHWYVVNLQKPFLTHMKSALSVVAAPTIAHFEVAGASFRQEVTDDLTFNGMASGDFAFETEAGWVNKFTNDKPIILFIRGTSANLLLARFKQWDPVRLDKYVPPNI